MSGPFTRPLDVLDGAALDRLEDAALGILAETGVVVRHTAVCERLADAGNTVDGERVHLDADWVLARVADAPTAFTLHARSAARSVAIGGGSLALTASGGSPFVSDRERGRRDGTLAEYIELVRMAHATDLLAVQQSGTTETADVPETWRHLEMDATVLRMSDKPFVAYGTAGERAADGIELARIAFGGALPGAVLVGIVNPNSPLVFDAPMMDALVAWAEAGQAVAITPFVLAGATAPVGLAGSLALQLAEALAGIAMVQAVAPGCPCLLGSFTTAIDMRSGGPAFGGPESTLATLAGGQLARRYGVPYRGGGGLCAANVPDAQAASEAAMALWATYLSGADLVLHAAGWLEGGLTSSYEKFALDLELIAQLEVLRRGIAVDDEHLALDAIREEGPGGMFLAAEHTLAHYREHLYMSPLFAAQAYATWEKRGGRRADEVATDAWKALLARYEDPGMDDTVERELRAYVGRRRGELGDG